MADISIEQIAVEIVSALEARFTEAWDKVSLPDTTKREAYKAWEKEDLIERIKRLAGEDKIKPYNPLTMLGAGGAFGVDKTWLLVERDSEYLRHAFVSYQFQEKDKKIDGKPVSRRQFQDREILRIIKELGYDPKRLPANVAGKPGVKSKVKKLLVDPMWTKDVFKHAWDRLLGCKDISYC